MAGGFELARSVAIIGAGQIGRSAAYQFGFHGWDVAVYARSQPDWHDPECERWIEYTLGHDDPPSADVVLDTLAFDDLDIARYSPENIGRLITISSASVYCDEAGRTLDEAAQNGFPEFDGPITEECETVSPGPQTYSTRKIRMEAKARDMFGDRATVLRPCAIFGEHSRHPREWWFVKRMLDSRKNIPLSLEGRSQFSTTSAQCLAAIIQQMADDDVGGVFNIADEPAPTVLEIGQDIARYLRCEVDFKLLGGPPKKSIGRTPWSVPKPFVVSNAKADSQSYFCIGSGRDRAVHWLRDLNPADWRAAFPQLAAYPWDLFDYEAEDRFFASL